MITDQANHARLDVDRMFAYARFDIERMFACARLEI